jgi:hypothetical protein
MKRLALNIICLNYKHIVSRLAQLTASRFYLPLSQLFALNVSPKQKKTL